MGRMQNRVDFIEMARECKFEGSKTGKQRGKSFDGPAGLRYNFPRRSRVAQRQSNRLLTGGL